MFDVITPLHAQMMHDSQSRERNALGKIAEYKTVLKALLLLNNCEQKVAH